MAEKPMGLEELVFWGGFMAGAIAGYLTLKTMEVNQLVLTLGSLGTGMVLGFVCDQIYQRMKAPPGGPGDDYDRYPPR